MATLQLSEKYDNYDFPITPENPQPGHYGNINEIQAASVEQLRLMLEAEGYTNELDTLTLLRFLRARKWVVADAKKMFVDFIAWRKSIKLDEIVPTWDYSEKQDVQKYYKQFYHKIDKDGRPVYIETLGGIDLAAMYKITSEERMLNNLAVEYERVADPRLPACSRKAGHLLETCCTIMDFKGVGIGKASQVYDYVKKASTISQNYYPERLGKLYLINTPWGFSAVWSIVSGWLDPVTVSKIKVLGSGYQKDLLAQVPAENLPKAFGGTCECAQGCENSDAGPWHDPQWSKPAKWEKKDTTIVNQGSAIETPAAGAPAPLAERPRKRLRRLLRHRWDETYKRLCYDERKQGDKRRREDLGKLESGISCLNHKRGERGRHLGIFAGIASSYTFSLTG
ncbi:Sec14 cytosolic factor [Cladobotryum mycophilum]|uniref:Sec14 cytosolic factor n=1 Tax=Cladobotryum mycophilum TaxID=491253 RepID=A0ABR0STP3_9HYPO